MKRVTGIGGIFFKAKDAPSMREGGLSRARGRFFFGLCFLPLKAVLVFICTDHRRAFQEMGSRVCSVICLPSSLGRIDNHLIT
jgi:hypothetical protein